MKAQKKGNIVDANLRKKIVTSLVDAGLTKPVATTYEKNIYDNISTKEEYINLVYEKLGEVHASSKDHLPTLTNGWESSFYTKEKEKYENSIVQTNTKIKPIKGVYVCRNKKCGSDEFYIWREQRSSNDESMSVIRQCAKCLARGVER